jgi:hypothetical protein
VLNTAVCGFGSHEVRHDHVWRKQGMVGRATVPKAKAKVVPSAASSLSNVQELFPDKS